MSDRRWLERVQSILLRRGLPSEYVDRLIQELADHAEDIEGAGPEEGGPEDWLGDPEAIASEAVSAFRSASWGGRHPVAFFVLGPLAIALAGWGAYFALAIAGIELLTVGGSVRSVAAEGLARVAAAASGLVVPMLVVRALWEVYRPSGRPLRWYVGGCFLVSACGGLFIAELIPPSPTVGGELSAWLRFDLRWPWLQGAQFAMPLGVAGVLIARHFGRAVRGAGTWFPDRRAA